MFTKMAAKKNTVKGRDSVAAVIHSYLTSAETTLCVMVPNFVLTLGCGQLGTDMQISSPFMSSF